MIDEDFCALNGWLVGEIYSVAPADRLNYRHAWTMSPEYLTYCRDTLGTHWQPAVGTEAYLYGYEVEVDEKYGAPRLVRK